jgi:hypothetical protein
LVLFLSSTFIHSLRVLSLIGFLLILVVFSHPLSSILWGGGWKGVGTWKLDHRIIQVPLLFNPMLQYITVCTCTFRQVLSFLALL